MIWPSRICSRAALAVLAAGSLLAADVSGRFELTGSRVREVRSRGDYSGVAVWLEKPGGETAPLATGRHTIRQQGKRFVPHVSVVQAGATIELPNLDPIFHNAFSNFSGQRFDTGLYPPGTSRQIRFVRPGLVRVFCNIHASMSAIIAVVPTPWYAVSARDGSFTIRGVLPGEYDLQVWHERATEDTLRPLRRRIRVPAEGLNTGSMAISEAGFVALPHKNKYGQEYPPEPNGKAPYEGSRP